jgi:succinoglycan biosynthesis transport protein ExoP
MNQPMQPPPMMTPGTGGSPQPGRFTPVDPLRLLKQYKWILLLTLIVGIGLGIGAHFLLLQTAPKYTATAQIQVQPELSSALSFRTDAIGNSDALEMFKRTQALFIQTERNLRDAINSPLIQNSPWFADLNRDSQAAFEKLVDSLSIAPVANTQVINVSVEADRPRDAADLANAVVNAYIDWHVRLSKLGRDSVEQLFEIRKNRLEEEIVSIRNRMNAIMDEADLSATRTSFSETDWKFQQLIARNEELSEASVAAERAYSQLVEAAQSQTIEFTPEELYEVDAGPTIRAIDNKILALREELRVAQERFGADHRTVQGLKDRIRAAEAEREQERQRLLAQLQDVKISQAQSNLGALQAALADNERRLVEVRLRQRELREQLSTYEALGEELAQKKESYLRFEETLSQMDVVREHPNAARVTREVEATPPAEASFPQMKKVVPGVTVLLLFLVGGIAFLREMLDSRVKSPSDMKLLPKVSLLGVIPDAGEDPSSDGSIDQVVARKPTGLLAENFRQLRTEIVAHMQKHRFKTLMVVGCQPRGGNTAVAVNLANSVAYNGRRVLLIDANFRRPAVHSQFSLPQGPGLAELVSREVDIDAAVQSTDVENLDVMAIGQGDEHILERVESDVFTQALRKLEQTYELILIDAPPLSIVGDSRLLANRVDAVILTVRALQEKRGLVARLIRQLEDARAEFLGVVLNGVQSAAGGYFKRNYRAYYEYQNGGGKAAKTPRRSTKRRSKVPVELPEE